VILQNYYQKKYQQEPTVTHQNIYKDPVAVQFMLEAPDNPGTVGATVPSKISQRHYPRRCRYPRPSSLNADRAVSRAGRNRTGDGADCSVMPGGGAKRRPWKKSGVKCACDFPLQNRPRV
jgi:hypothetical protein